MPEVPGSLEALLAKSIDYAGLYPPADLPLSVVSEKYDKYRNSQDAWILNRVVLPAAELAEVRPRLSTPADLAGGGVQASNGIRITAGKDRLRYPCPGWRITLLVEGEPGPLPPEVETLETKLERRLSLPTYCEAPLTRIEGGFAKIRTGGVTPEAIPDSATVAEFIVAAAARRMPFKATAGLHHAVRSLRPLTYAADAPRATMHGFINVLTAACFVWHGAGREAALAIVNEEDPGAFVFLDARMTWRGRELPNAAIRSARAEFVHSFGSCSFEEPLADLRALGWLP